MHEDVIMTSANEPQLALASSLTRRTNETWTSASYMYYVLNKTTDYNDM